MTSLGEYGRREDAVHRVDLQLIRCSTYRRPELEGRVADGRYAAEQSIRPEKGQP
jgi:hypothetical protein